MIDVLEQITYYRNLKGWSEYQLAEQSGLTQSTISAWYRKKLYPTIPSLEKICNAFDITLSQFFADKTENFELTTLQKEFLNALTHFSTEQQMALLEFFKKL